MIEVDSKYAIKLQTLLLNATLKTMILQTAV